MIVDTSCLKGVLAPMLRRNAITGVVLALGLALSACQINLGDTDAPPPPDLTFQNQKPHSIFVNRIQIEEGYQPPLAPPNIEHQFGIFPTEIVRNWTKDRLRPVGNDGTLTVTIADAHVVESVLPIKTGFLGRFANEVDRQWDARMDVRLTYKGRFGTASARVIAKATQQLTEKASEYDRHRAYFAILEGLAVELDSALDQEFKGPLSLLVLQDTGQRTSGQVSRLAR